MAQARRKARLWRVAPPRQRRYTQPGCGLGALLQRLTIDATTEAELHLHLDAARSGFAAEGLALVLPPEPAALAALGPRVTPLIVARLRRIGCPSSAAALLLALATDARAGQVASCSPRSSRTSGRPGYCPAPTASPSPRGRCCARRCTTISPAGCPPTPCSPEDVGVAAAAPDHGQPHRPRRRARRPPDPARGHLGRARRLRSGRTVLRRSPQRRSRPDRRRRASPTTATSPTEPAALNDARPTTTANLSVAHCHTIARFPLPQKWGSTRERGACRPPGLITPTYRPQSGRSRHMYFQPWCRRHRRCRLLGRRCRSRLAEPALPRRSER